MFRLPNDFDKSYRPLYFLPAKLKPYSYFGGAICDGVDSNDIIGSVLWCIIG